MTPQNKAADLPGWKHVYSGKVRDLYEPESTSEHLLIVASDRVSAFDHVLEPPIPGKGALLTALTKWWFERLSVPNHLADDGPQIPEHLADRAVVANKLKMLPIECVVRGAITGSGYQEYLATGSVCGIKLPVALSDGDLLGQPIFTPAYKAPMGEHDQNISFEQTAELVGQEMAERLRDASLEIFAEASELANSLGLILADTKFEFGLDPLTGELTLADEVLTSDSSRYWDAEIYHASRGAEGRMQSFDKQIVRDWLAENWDGVGTPPTLPQDIVDRTRARYEELLQKFLNEEGSDS